LWVSCRPSTAPMLAVQIVSPIFFFKQRRPRSDTHGAAENLKMNSNQVKHHYSFMTAVSSSIMFCKEWKQSRHRTGRLSETLNSEQTGQVTRTGFHHHNRAPYAITRLSY
jgi:predicted O-linked N-acetylglucosamine transferase (SPINDLY family)